MIGIKSMGGYIPRYRLKRAEIARAMGGFSMPGSNAVCNFDEDSITMAVEAIRNSLDRTNAKEIDALFFGSTTAPYKEKQSSSTIALGADLSDKIFTCDLSNSLRSGVSAILLAMDRVGNGQSKNAMVAASDCRIGMCGSEFEKSFGDGSAALLIGNENLIATIDDSFYLDSDFIDIWRTENDRFVSTWEDRFIKTKGFQKIMNRVIKGLMDKCGLGPSDYQKAIINVPDFGTMLAVAKTNGFDPKAQLQHPMFDTIGYSGSAHPLLMLIAALEEGSPGDKLLFASYGDGAIAMTLTLTEQISSYNITSIKDCLENQMELESYETYLKLRKLIETEADRIPALPSSAPYMWRDQNYFTRFYGSKCKKCGTTHYPRHRVCYKCKSKDDFEVIKLADKKGEIITYTKDGLFPSPIPPHVQTVIELEGGCRIYAMMTDVKPDELENHMQIEMTFRLLHERSNFKHYGWKCRPLQKRRIR